MDKPYLENPRFHWWMLVTVCALILLMAHCCMGCIPEHQKKGNEVNRVFSGMVENDERVPEDVRTKATPVRKMNEQLVETHGRPDCIVTEENVAEKAGDVEEEAKAYVPFMQRLIGLSTGNDLIDALIALVLGGGVAAGRKKIKSGLHWLSHNGKEGS